MIIWIMTDMEGLSGVDNMEQFSPEKDDAPEYRYGLEQLTAEANAAIAGCFDAGATEVRICDGHGKNQNRGFTADLDPRAKKVHVASRNPIRWDGLDESVHAFAMIGQHAMAGTINAYLDHTQSSKVICRYFINGEEAGEMSQMALYAGGVGAPLFYVSGDEALCAEAARLFPHAHSTPTKRGTGWETCDLYSADEVRANIRRDIAFALGKVDRSKAWRLPPPIEVAIEWAWTGRADPIARIPGVRRPHARTVAWDITDQRDVFDRPNPAWHPTL
jgi:D-amino peptidase